MPLITGIPSANCRTPQSNCDLTPIFNALILLNNKIDNLQNITEQGFEDLHDQIEHCCHDDVVDGGEF